METLFEGKSCKAEYIKENKLVFYTLTGYADVEEHKKMYIKVLDFMQSNKTVAFLHDLQKMKGTFTQLNDWIVNTFRPATQLGLRYAAMIMNDDIFTEFAANDIIKKTSLVQLQVFKSKEDAEAWINEKTKEA